MQKHTKLYLEEFYPKWGPDDCFECEIEECHACATDIHHIEARGMGGRPSKDNVDNLMALCRYHHDAYGDKTEYKQLLAETHLKFKALRKCEK